MLVSKEGLVEFRHAAVAAVDSAIRRVLYDRLMALIGV